MEKGILFQAELSAQEKRDACRGKWDREALVKWLREEAEEEYGRFAASLLPPGGPVLLGVRLPKLRKAAGEIAKGEWRGFLSAAGEEFFEEIMLRGMVIGALSPKQVGREELFQLIEGFLPKICNWSLCDSFCSSLKIARRYPDEMFDFLLPLLSSSHGYTIRFAVVMMQCHYLREPYIKEVLERLETVTSTLSYVRMALAWTYCSCWLHCSDEVWARLEQGRLSPEVRTMTIQKLLDSRRVSPEAKEWLRGFRTEARRLEMF